MTERAAPRVALAQRHCLAEGPLWDATRQRLLWVDIHRGQVFQGQLLEDRSIQVVSTVHLDPPVSAVAVAADGWWVIAGRDQLIYRSPDGALTDGPAVFRGHPTRRLNDGKCDPAGRFVIGSLDESGTSQSEILAVLDNDSEVAFLDTDLTLSNGLAWAAHGRMMYSVDTLVRRIYQRPYDPDTGATGQRSVFTELTSGFPDGIAIDSEDHLWVAVWGAGQVHRYSPDGVLVDVISVPAPHVSSVAFGGRDLDTLVITTASAELPEESLSEFPESGRIFTFAPGVIGRAESPWAGIPPASITNRINQQVRE